MAPPSSDPPVARRGHVIEDATMRLEFLATAAETEGRLHEMRVRYAPNTAFPPAHHHPSQEERFIVEQGRLRFVLNGREHEVTAGEEIVVPARTVHRVRNPGEDPAIAVWQTRPALRTAEFLERATAAQATGDLVGLLATVQRYGDVYRLAVRPRWVTAPAVRALGTVARTLPRGRQRAR